MNDVNLAIIMGNLTRDPELRYTPNGQAVASFGVATNRSWNDASGEKKEEVEFHNVVVWGKLAELCSQYITKGRKVHVMGRLQTSSWEGTDGAKRQKTEIVATDVVFLGSKGGEHREGSFADSLDDSEKSAKKPKKSETKKETENNEEEISIDDIPF